MEDIQKAVLIGHTLIALLIIILVLMQRGKGADAGAAFGAGAPACLACGFAHNCISQCGAEYTPFGVHRHPDGEKKTACRQ